MSVHVFIDKKQLTGYTSLSLSRDKSDLTGQLQIDIFMNWMPSAPVFDVVTKGKEITVYVGGHLVFYGSIDRRSDQGTTGQPRDEMGPFVSGPSQGSGPSLSISSSEYKVTLSCRGKAGKLVDNSQQHETGTMLGTTNRDAMAKLIEPWGIELDWKADVIEAPRVRFRDGARVVDEIERLCEQFGMYAYETRDGKLRVVDKAETQIGEPIVLGVNILSFSTDQSADQERSEVLVKGQLTDPQQWGENAVIPTLERLKDSTLESFSPITVQLYGRGTPDLLKRRAYYEMNKRAADGKQINVEVFHVQQTDGEPWDLGQLHYVEIPPAGVFGQFETIKLTYNVDAKGTLRTKLTLAPKPAASPSVNPPNGAVLSSLPDIAAFGNIDIAARIARFGVSGLISSWASPDILQLALNKLAGTAQAQLLDVVQSGVDKPPLELPPSYGRSSQ